MRQTNGKGEAKSAVIYPQLGHALDDAFVVAPIVVAVFVMLMLLLLDWEGIEQWPQHLFAYATTHLKAKLFARSKVYARNSLIVFA